ncbi:hypothetical protein M404DRAFT_991897 [Pisolithus tinctorius Marx 270]|uniref:Uncharacterized protein n=1 Tax=Pisolithus tinctorius Marx 270 TaxID=870435 RepID=A0A0C3PLK8_PISTI|nr:hypothetical protein M404DRAFT_991897 [Pisolithus tinctorius Marx 270]
MADLVQGRTMRYQTVHAQERTGITPLVQVGYIHRGRREYPRRWIAINRNTASLGVIDGLSWRADMSQ